MNIKQIKKDLGAYRKRYGELYQYVFVENLTNTKGYEFAGEIELLDNEIKHLERLLTYC